MAMETTDFDRTLTRGSMPIIATAPLFLAIAGFGRYWMSCRALNAVDQVTQRARTVGAQDLTKRLVVAPARDDLALLAETLKRLASAARIDVEERSLRTRRFA